MNANEYKPEPPNRFNQDEGFKDKTLLITGGTGFLGKALIENILRTCHLVKRIYVLLRAKNGKNPQERIEEIMRNPLFDLVKQTRGNDILKKVVAVSSDVRDLGLGLSKENRRMLAEEVEVFYHVAATVRFDEPLKRSVLINTRGTQLALDLAKQCEKLLVFVHVSTAYCHLGEKVLYEKAYPPPADPHAIIKLVETTTEETVEEISKKVMGSSPNSYCFSKALAEDLVNDEIDNLPVIILRPSVVIATWKDPLPGWVDNINGPVGLSIATGKGLLRTMYGNPDAYGDYLSVDVAANFTLVATYDYLNNKSRHYYNLTSSNEYKITFAELMEKTNHVFSRMPYNSVVWYPGGSMTSSKVLHKTRVVLQHYLPALVLDLLIVLTGNKPVLWKIQQRITKGLDMLEFYSTNQWNFNNVNMMTARRLMNETEKKMYDLDVKTFDTDSYILNAIHGSRLYLLNETDDTLPGAFRHIKIMWVVDRVCKILMVLGFGYLLLQYVVNPIFGTSPSLGYTIVPKI